MSEEREVSTPDGVPTTPIPESRESKKARFAQIVDRGYVTHRLNSVNLPDDMHGQWVRNVDIEIDRMKGLDYVIAEPDKYKPHSHAKHGDGTTISVGDVVFMVCSKEDHELHQELAKERFHQAYVKQPREGIKLQKEFKSLESAGISLQDQSTPAQVITNPKDI